MIRIAEVYLVERVEELAPHLRAHVGPEADITHDRESVFTSPGP